MYGIFTNICPKNHPNVGKYTIHGAYGYVGVYVIMVYVLHGWRMLLLSGAPRATCGPKPRATRSAAVRRHGQGAQVQGLEWSSPEASGMVTSVEIPHSMFPNMDKSM